MAGTAQVQWWENAQMGPYKLLWPIGGDLLGGPWSVFAARHEETEAPALVVIPTEDADWAPQVNWQGRVSGSTAPVYLAVDVDRLPDEEAAPFITDDMDVLTCVWEELELRREAVQHLRSRPRKRRAQARQKVASNLATPNTTASGPCRVNGETCSVA